MGAGAAAVWLCRMPSVHLVCLRTHEALGDDATEDLLACFQEANEVNRDAVRELAELFLARSEARIDQRMAELRAEFHSAIGGLRGELFSAVGELRGELHSGLASLRGELHSQGATLRGDVNASLANQRAELLKWMFLFWAGTVVPLAGLILAIRR